MAKKKKMGRPKLVKMGRPPTGTPGKVISFNCKHEHLEYVRSLRLNGNLSPMINHLIGLEREFGAGLPNNNEKEP